MVFISELQIKLATDTWVAATWNESIQIIEYPIYEKTKCYYFGGKFRIEMATVGNDRACAIILLIAND